MVLSKSLEVGAFGNRAALCSVALASDVYIHNLAHKLFPPPIPKLCTIPKVLSVATHHKINIRCADV